MNFVNICMNDNDDAFFQSDWAGAYGGRRAGLGLLLGWSAGFGSSGRR